MTAVAVWIPVLCFPSVCSLSMFSWYSGFVTELWRETQPFVSGSNGSAREKLFHLTLEAAAESISTDERDERPMPDTANHSD